MRLLRVKGWEFGIGLVAPRVVMHRTRSVELFDKNAKQVVLDRSKGVGVRARLFMASCSSKVCYVEEISRF